MRTIRAEFLKIVTLPVIGVCFLASACACLALLLLVRHAGGASAGQATLTWAMPACLLSPILCGAAAASQEYSGSQVRTTLLATPSRLRAVMSRWSVWAVTFTLGGGAIILLLSGAVGTMDASSMVPRWVLITAVWFFAAFATDLTRSFLAGVIVTVVTVWFLPFAAKGLPEVLAVIPAPAVSALAAGAWPSAWAVGAAWCLALAAASLVRQLVSAANS